MLSIKIINKNIWKLIQNFAQNIISNYHIMKKKRTYLFVLAGILLVVSLTAFGTGQSASTSGKNAVDVEQNIVDKNIESASNDFNDLVKTKLFHKEQDSYTLFYRYPFLDTSKNTSYHAFNDYITNTYLNLDNSIKDLLNGDKSSCDIGYNHSERLKRLVDYKIYAFDNDILSVLLYKSNQYEDETQFSYLFKTLNFDVNTGNFISFDSIFKPNSELQVLNLINNTLETKVSLDEKYEECWLITPEIFIKFKDNFVLDSETVKFYFDDCTMCPVYSGNYFIEISRQELLEFSKAKT